MFFHIKQILGDLFLLNQRFQIIHPFQKELFFLRKLIVTLKMRKDEIIDSVLHIVDHPSV